jgi:hypothetical protein
MGYKAGCQEEGRDKEEEEWPPNIDVKPSTGAKHSNSLKE